MIRVECDTEEEAQAFHVFLASVFGPMTVYMPKEALLRLNAATRASGDEGYEVEVVPLTDERRARRAASWHAALTRAFGQDGL